MTTFLRFVRHKDVDSYKNIGWVVVDDLAGTHHGYHAVIMAWMGEGEPQ